MGGMMWHGTLKDSDDPRVEPKTPTGKALMCPPMITNSSMQKHAKAATLCATMPVFDTPRPVPALAVPGGSHGGSAVASPA